MNTEHIDAIVIGAGQGGTPLSLAMAKHGWRTALIERRAVGGTCLNDGCVPTKTYIASARVAALARRAAEFGVGCGPVTADLRAIRQRKDKLLTQGRASIETAFTQQEHLELLYGSAFFAYEQPNSAACRVEVALRDGGNRLLSSPRVFLDVGARPSQPALDGLASVPFLDSTSILDLEELPQHLLILGGGSIAVEFAQMFRRFGSDVTIVQREAKLLEQEDDDIAQCLLDLFREDGIHVFLKTEALSVHMDGQDVCLSIQTGQGVRMLRGSHLLVATGRTPNADSLHLERVHVETGPHGFVSVNERLETSRSGIWALGDVKGGPAYTHVSYDDFRILETNLLKGGSRTTGDRLIPHCVFTDPELGRVGLTEKEARDSGLDVLVATLPMEKVARAREMSETRGMLKAVVSKSTGNVLGAAALCVDGGEIATQIQFAMLGGLNANGIVGSIIAHPVLAEGLHPLFKALR